MHAYACLPSREKAFSREGPCPATGPALWAGVWTRVCASVHVHGRVPLWLQPPFNARTSQVLSCATKEPRREARCPSAPSPPPSSNHWTPLPFQSRGGILRPVLQTLLWSQVQESGQPDAHGLGGGRGDGDGSWQPGAGELLTSSASSCHPCQRGGRRGPAPPASAARRCHLATIPAGTSLAPGLVRESRGPLSPWVQSRAMPPCPAGLSWPNWWCKCVRVKVQACKGQGAGMQG